MTVTRMLARPMLASIFAVAAVGALRNSQALAPKAAKVTDKVVPVAKRAVPQVPIPSDPATLVKANAVLQLAAAGAFATGRAPRTSSLVLAASMVPTTVVGHPFWEETDPAQKNNQRLHFVKNLSIIGGLLIAGVDTEGKPGVAWRARRAAKDVRREAEHLGRAARREAKAARREAKLVKAQLT